MAETNSKATVVGVDSHMRGELVFERAASVLGNFEGKITGHGELHVAEGAVCKAEISAGTVIVDGVIQGNVHASERIQLNNKGRIHGDVIAPKFVVADGAQIIGSVTIGEEPGRAGKSTSTSTGAPAKEASSPVGLSRRP